MSARRLASVLLSLQIGLGAFVLRTGSKELELCFAELPQNLGISGVGLALLLSSRMRFSVRQVQPREYDNEPSLQLSAASAGLPTP